LTGTFAKAWYFIRAWMLSGFPIAIFYSAKPEGSRVDGRWHRKCGFLVIELFYPIIDGTEWQVIRHEIFHSKSYDVDASIKAEAARIYAMTNEGEEIRQLYAELPELKGSDWDDEALVRLADKRANRQTIPGEPSRALKCALARLTRPRPIAAVWSAIVGVSVGLAAWLVVAGMASAAPLAQVTVGPPNPCPMATSFAPSVR